MNADAAPSIFISYSHTDSDLVVPVVSLLRASKALVFRDADSIHPGKRWTDEIASAISEANIVVVFWCRHAKSSPEVEKEFMTAIAEGKDILPLLLDETPLPNRLAEFQYIDFRTAFAQGHGNEKPPLGRRAAIPGGARRYWILGLVTSVLISVVVGLPFYRSLQLPPEQAQTSGEPRNSSSPEGADKSVKSSVDASMGDHHAPAGGRAASPKPPSTPEPTPEQAPSGLEYWKVAQVLGDAKKTGLTAAILLGLGLSVFLSINLRRRWIDKHRLASGAAADESMTPPGEEHRLVAKIIESELVRRVGGVTHDVPDSKE